MADVKQMMFPLMILLLSFNAMYLFMIYLPANENQAFGPVAWRDGNFGSVDKTGLQNTLNSLISDTNSSITTPLTDVNGQATTTERTNAAGLSNLIFGVGAGVVCGVLGFLAGGVVGGIVGGAACSLVGYFLKYFTMLAFGFFSWIDFFIPNTGGFMWLGLGIKAIFSIIMIMGLLTYLLPLFSSWRK